MGARRSEFSGGRDSSRHCDEALRRRSAIIPARHPVIAWRAQHSADVLNWITKGPEGKTPYSNVRGKPFQTCLMRCGKTCRWNHCSHATLSATGDRRRFHTGTFIGIGRRFGQYMMHGDEGIKFARTVVRLPKGSKFDEAELSKVASTPWDWQRPRETEVIFKEKKEEQDDLMREDKIALSRAVYIKLDDLTKFGLTRGCPKCDHKIAYGPGCTSKPHSTKCRARIMGSLPTRPREEFALLPQQSALTGQWPNWATSIAVMFPRGGSQRLCNIKASQKW